MSGVNCSIAGQNEQTAANMFTQLVEVSSGEVCTADASLKQHVAAKQTVLFFAVINDAAGGMTGYVDCFQLGVSERDDSSVAYIFS